jgi:hypothetical protein
LVLLSLAPRPADIIIFLLLVKSHFEANERIIGREFCKENDDDDDDDDDDSKNKGNRAIGWKFSKSIGYGKSKCGKYFLFGGYGTFGGGMKGWKVYDTLTPHYKVKLSFTLVKIDRWDPTRQVVFELNGVTRKSYNFPTVNGKFDWCGRPGKLYGEEYVDVVMEVRFKILSKKKNYLDLNEF